MGRTKGIKCYTATKIAPNREESILIAGFFKTRLAAKGLTVSLFAVRAGISPATVTKTIYQEIKESSCQPLLAAACGFKSWQEALKCAKKSYT